MIRVNAHEVARFVAGRHGLTLEHLCGDRRNRSVARPRQIAMYAIKTLCHHMSYPGIGRMLGGRDHTTILHGVRKVEALMKTDPVIAAEVGRTIAYFRSREENALDREIVNATALLGDLISQRRHIELAA